nr:WD repeat-containing protein 27 [Polyrhizophydium stewartii]
MPSSLPAAADASPDAVCAVAAAPDGPAVCVTLAERLFHDRPGDPLLQPDAVLPTTALADPADPVLCVRFGRAARPLKLFVGCRRSLSVWTCAGQADGGAETSAVLEGIGSFTHRLLRTDVGRMHHLAVHALDAFVAACVGDSVVIVAVETCAAVCLQGHLGNVTMCEFFDGSANRHAKTWILTVSEDRTFKVWDYTAPACIFSSQIVSSSPFTAIAFDPYKPVFALGSEDSVVRFYDPAPQTQLPKASQTHACEPRIIKSIDVSAMRSTWAAANPGPSNSDPAKPGPLKIVSSLPAWRRGAAASGVAAAAAEPTVGTNGASEEGQDGATVEHAVHVIGMFYPRRRPASHLGMSPLVQSSLLMVACPTMIAIVDTGGYTLAHVIDFASPCLNTELFATADESIDPTVRAVSASISTVRSASFAQPTCIWNCVVVCLTDSLTGQITVLRVHDSDSNGTSRRVDQSADAGGDSLYDCVKSAVASHVSGERWIDNIVADCMSQLSQLGIHDLADVPGVLGDLHDDESSTRLPGFVERALVSATSAPRSDVLSFVDDPSMPQHPCSILRAALANQESPTKQRTKALTAKSTASGMHGSALRSISTDKPVTFRAKVKSSGYTQPPAATKMFSGTKSATRSGAKALAAAKQPGLIPQYPSEGGPLTKPISPPFTTTAHTSSITCVRFHPAGRLLGTGSADKSARFYRTQSKDSVSASRDFLGHSGGVTDFVWRLNPVKDLGYIALTTSHDGCVRLWCTERPDPLLVLAGASSAGSAAASVASASSSAAGPRRRPASVVQSASARTIALSGAGASSSTMHTHPTSQHAVHARFMHRDRILVSTRGSRMTLSTYALVRPDPSHIVPPSALQGTSSAASHATRLGSLTTTAHTFSAIACVNAVPSRLVVSAASDKSLVVWDLDAMRAVGVLRNAHARPAHWLAVGETGDAVVRGFEHTFASVCIGEGIKLWDLRCSSGSANAAMASAVVADAANATPARPVMQMNGHTNRYAHVRFAISPCGMYLASGSEDHHAYIFDIRTGMVAGKTGGNHGETVVAVDFHPTRRELVTACQDGWLRFFGDSWLQGQ